MQNYNYQGIVLGVQVLSVELCFQELFEGKQGCLCSDRGQEAPPYGFENSLDCHASTDSQVRLLCGTQ